MTVTKCDRCGKEMKYAQVHMHMQLRVTMLYQNVFGQPSKNIDLCGECSDQLYEFIFWNNKERNTSDA